MASKPTDQFLTTYLREMETNPENETVCFLEHTAERLETLSFENRMLKSLLVFLATSQHFPAVEGR